MMKKGKVKQFHQDNRGGAMAMVLIIIAFISVLAGVLMFAAYGGYQMRLVDKQGTDNFYSAETVLDEINAGLQAEVSQALAKSYEQVMVNYALYETAEKRSEVFYDVYCDELTAILGDPSKPDSYRIEKLRGYLTGDVLGDGDGSRANFGSYGAIVESNLSSGAYTMVRQADGVLLKDLKVSYVNQTGYVSIISTDVHIVLPTANFSQSSAFPGLEEYCLIADETLNMGNTLSDGEIKIKGNAYAGEMLLGKAVGGTMLSSNISFSRVDDADPDSLSVVISRGDITIAESKIVTENVELWGENFVLDSAKAQMDGSTNLKDDLVLVGNGSEVTLAGEYAGFGNAADGAALSSAIVVNGRDSYLDLTGLTSMNVSGRSYVATAVGSQNAAEEETTETVEQQNKVDIAMGESVAVKSNQLIYLVPPEALGCVINEDGTTGETMYGSNPLKMSQYEEIVNHPEKYVLLDGKRPVAALGYKSLDNYIKQEEVSDEDPKYVPEIICKKTNDETLVYCYLRFKDDNAANRYFADYYSVNYDKVNSYMKLYTKEIKLGSTDSMLYLNLAGNMLSFSESTGGTLVEATDSYGEQKVANVISVTKSDIFKALCAKMVTNIAQLSAEEQGNTAFENIIKPQNLEKIVNKFDNFGTGFVQIDTGAADSKSVILSKYNYTVDSSTPDSVHMIVCLGDVVVKKDFKGLIISAKNIRVEDSDDIDHKVCIEALTLEDFTEMLLAKKVDGSDEYYVLDVFRDGVNYAYSGSTVTDVGTETVSMTDLIIYERWSKR